LRLQGKTILITGASGGFGRGIALACAAEGADLALVGRNEERQAWPVWWVWQEQGGDLRRRDATKRRSAAVAKAQTEPSGSMCWSTTPV
jgi:NAD(P)-dependent dehydrogenase (short-subunit alcohol dehydrogenase family)